jgi:alpha-tubulin suppressor-like RCC1 family protein
MKILHFQRRLPFP